MGVLVPVSQTPDVSIYVPLPFTESEQGIRKYKPQASLSTLASAYQSNNSEQNSSN